MSRPRQHHRGSKKWRGQTKQFVTLAIRMFNVVLAEAYPPMRLVGRVPPNPRWQRKDTHEAPR